ncbi:hypothetical protein PENTCL1PPCAC_16325, partial [Pristionchus entomophagus]
ICSSDLMYENQMSTLSATISNFFDLIKVGDSHVKSLPPHCSLIVPGRIYGGLLVSQTINSLVTLHTDFVPHTFNFKYIAPGKTNLPLQFTLTPYEDANIVSISVSQSGKLVGMGHIRYSTSPDMLDSSLIPCYGCESPEEYPSMVEMVGIMEGKMKCFLEVS